MNEEDYRRIYYVLKESVPLLSNTPEEDKKAIVEELVRQEKAVRQPEFNTAGMGKSFISKKLMMEFLIQYDPNPNFEKFEI